MSSAAPLMRRPLVRWALAIALVTFSAIIPLLAISIPGVLPGPSYTPGTLQLLALCLVFAALALSYHVLFGAAGMLSFGHALYFAAGAYGLDILLKRTGIALLPAIGLTLLIVLLGATVLGAVSLRVGGISFAMVTLAFAEAGSVLVRRNVGVTGGDDGLPLATDQVPDWLVGVLNTRNLYWIALAVLVAVFLLVRWFEHSRAGHVVAATRENELRARVLGLPPFQVKLLAFVFASVLAAVAGVVYLLLQSGATPQIASSNFTLTILVIVVLGGVGSRWGAVIGGIVYTLLDQRLSALAGSDAIAALPPVLRIPLQEPPFLLGTLFILVVLFLPGGIVGLAGRRAPGSRPAENPRDTLEEVS
jgi:branched-chain amino acid transport system permease protein